jgi:hypothetical protein
MASTRGLFSAFDTYDPFFNTEYISPYFRKVGFVETSEAAALVESAYSNDFPFAEINIPASTGGNVLKAVGLGLMVAILFSVGLVPNSEIQI